MRTLLLGDRATAPTAADAVPVLAAADDDPIAIVAMSCRFPGGVASPEDLWSLVADGVTRSVTSPTTEAGILSTLFDPDPENQGTSYVRQGAFLYDAGEFDAGFFGILAA